MGLRGSIVEEPADCKKKDCDGQRQHKKCLSARAGKQPKTSTEQTKQSHQPTSTHNKGTRQRATVARHIPVMGTSPSNSECQDCFDSGLPGGRACG